MVSTFFLDFKQSRRGLPKRTSMSAGYCSGQTLLQQEFGCDRQFDAGLEATRDRFRVHPVDKKRPLWFVGMYGFSASREETVVLVVEDESLVLFSAVEMVTEAGFDAIPTSNADEAIRILERRHPSCFHRRSDARFYGRARTCSRRAEPLASRGSRRDFRAKANCPTDLPSGRRFLGKPYQPSQTRTCEQTVMARYFSRARARLIF